jgi:hypothetical protein
MADTLGELVAHLARGVAAGAELQKQLGVSQATLSRAIKTLGEGIVRIGSGRAARYGLRREFPDIGSSWPVFEIGRRGEPLPYGRLHSLAREQYWFAAARVENSHISDGLPFFLQDSWPQGFIGRTVPKRFPELGLPARISDWNDKDVLTLLTQRGDDSIGNLLIGDGSLQKYLKQFQLPPANVEPDDRPTQYPLLADTAIAGAPAGSSAGGEHPKFTTVVNGKDGVRHVLVKFSPARSDRAAQRWFDLLVAEHVASKALGTIGVSASATDLIVARDRMFLEVERFDRVGDRGRIGIVSLAAISDHYIGRRDNWTSAGESLAAIGKMSADDVDAIRRAATFGQLIGNTDMHFGNLSLYSASGAAFPLAPLYDMLPMMYAPMAGDALPDREFDVPMPSASNLAIWKSIAAAAAIYWRDVAGHERISKDFASIALRNAAAISRAIEAVP